MNARELKHFTQKVQIDTQTGCWLWIAGLNAKGYAQCWSNGHNNLGHRVSYQHFVGPIASGMELDHTCQHERCVNPQHLEIVTGAENLLRKYAVANMQKIFCVYFVKTAPVLVQ